MKRYLQLKSHLPRDFSGESLSMHYIFTQFLDAQLYLFFCFIFIVTLGSLTSVNDVLIIRMTIKNRQ